MFGNGRFRTGANAPSKDECDNVCHDGHFQIWNEVIEGFGLNNCKIELVKSDESHANDLLFLGCSASVEGLFEATASYEAVYKSDCDPDKPVPKVLHIYMKHGKNLSSLSSKFNSQFICYSDRNKIVEDIAFGLAHPDEPPEKLNQDIKRLNQDPELVKVLSSRDLG